VYEVVMVALRILVDPAVLLEKLLRARTVTLSGIWHLFSFTVLLVAQRATGGTLPSGFRFIVRYPLVDSRSAACSLTSCCRTLAPMFGDENFDTSGVPSR
jgi:hypothetical protein